MGSVVSEPLNGPWNKILVVNHFLPFFIQTLLNGTNPNTCSQLTRTTICFASLRTRPVAVVQQAPTAKRIHQPSSPKMSPSTRSRCFSRKTSETRFSARATVRCGHCTQFSSIIFWNWDFRRFVKLLLNSASFLTNKDWLKDSLTPYSNICR